MGRGRKPILSWVEKLTVGGECNRLWWELADQQAKAKHWSQPHQRLVKKQQSDLVAAPVDVRDHKVWKDGVRRASAEIAEILSEAGAARLTVIHLKRPYGKRTEILDAAIRWCAAKYGKTISQRRAQDCWDEYSATMKRLQSEPTELASAR
ncbi:hypothetical protein [Bradyrhizobium canariense]|nr:hypothetical protein [Bradyrhizobium canariense]